MKTLLIIITLFIMQTLSFAQFTSDYTGEHIDSVISGDRSTSGNRGLLIYNKNEIEDESWLTADPSSYLFGVVSSDQTKKYSGGMSITHSDYTSQAINDNYLPVRWNSRMTFLHDCTTSPWLFNGATGIDAFVTLDSSVTVDRWRGAEYRMLAYINAGSTLTEWVGIRNYMDAGASATTGNITSAKNFLADFNTKTGATGTIANWYNYYSTGAPKTAVTSFYHFYGNGNYPSYFGGAVNSNAGYNFFVDAQANDTYVLTIKGIASYIAGMEITFDANTLNTDGATVNVNGLGAKALTKVTSAGVNTALATGDILAGQIVKAVYDGTQFQVISRLAQ